MDNASVEKILKQVKATMDFEGLTLTEEDIERGKKILTGEITGDDAIKEAFKRFKKA